MGKPTVKGNERRKFGRRSGFTLIEAVVAIFVISLFTSALLPLFTSSDRIVRTAQNREAATQASHEVLEQWREGGFAGLPVIPTGTSSVTSTFAPPTNLPNASGTIRVTRVDANFVASTIETDYRKVEATISWQGLKADRGTVKQATLIVKER